MKEFLSHLYSAFLLALVVILMIGLVQLIQWSTWHPPTKEEVRKANETYPTIPLDKKQWTQYKDGKG